MKVRFSGRICFRIALSPTKKMVGRLGYLLAAELPFAQRLMELNAPADLLQKIASHS